MSNSEDHIKRFDGAFNALHVEQSAHHILLTQLLGVLARDRSLRFKISEAFDQALDVAQTLSMSPPDSSNPEHGTKVLKAIEAIRQAVLI